jgi:hypothetical protein
MFSYRVRPRHIKRDGRPAFPVDGVLRFHLEPAPPFGGATGSERTVTRAVPAQVLLNPNTGRYEARSEQPFDEVDVLVEWTNLRARFQGPLFEIEGTFESDEALRDTLYGVYLTLPALLAPYLGEPPTVASVDGTLGGEPFRWELAQGLLRLHPTTTEDQEARLSEVATAFFELEGNRHRRLVAALTYFQRAMRLQAVGVEPWEFMGEMIVNLAKCLEVLFPGAPDQTREAIREGLRAVGYEDDEVEAHFVPVEILRSQLDSAHVFLAVLRQDELDKLFRYVDSVFGPFQELLKRLVASRADEMWVDQPHLLKPDPRVQATIGRLEDLTTWAPQS